MTSNFSNPPRSYAQWAATTGRELEEEINGWMAKCQRVEVERDALRTENERLRAALKRITETYESVPGMTAEVMREIALLALGSANCQ